MKQMLRMGYAIVIVLILILVLIALKKFSYWPFNKSYTAEDFDIEVIKSEEDYDFDGIDDYTDILNGARSFVAQKPKYKSKYYAGGYPDDDYYVCTDVFWSALNNAGYDFKKMIDTDISKNKDDYEIDVIDSNIDFRRVRNIKAFLDKYAEVLTNDINEYKEFQPGDIVIYSKSHIAIVSDKRNKNKIPYIIHHDGSYAYEEDRLNWGEIVGHYRFNLNDESVKISVN